MKKIKYVILRKKVLPSDISYKCLTSITPVSLM